MYYISTILINTILINTAIKLMQPYQTLPLAASYMYLAHRQPMRQRTKAVILSKYLSRNDLPRIILIRGKLFPDGYLHPIPAAVVIVIVLVVSG